MAYVRDSMEQLIKLMKQEDPMFACLYQEMAYSGSYWDGLRVKEATEFDLNIVFKLPCQVVPTYSTNTAFFCYICIKSYKSKYYM